MDTQAFERLSRWILLGSIALSLMLHGVVSVALTMLPPAFELLSAAPHDEVMIDVYGPEPTPPAPEPEVEPEATELPEPDPQPIPETPRPRPDRPVPQPDAPRAAPDEDPPPPPPAAEQVHDFGGQVLGATDGSGGWATAAGSGQDQTGPIGNPVAQTTGRDRAGSADGTVGGTGDGPATEARAVNYSQPARPPGNLNSLLERYYPPSARARSLEGVARVRFRVAADGSVTPVRVVSESPSGQGFGRACMTMLRNARFQPALDASGSPTAYTAPAPFSCRFSLR